jgi:RHS repeat-associated protein
VDTNNPTGYAQVVEEMVSGNVQRVYVYGHARLSQQQLIAGNWQASFYGYDGHGSVRYLTDAAGAITDTYTYDAFGVLINRTGTTPNDYLYAGEQFDAALGLYYNRARYYSFNAGRFMTSDSFGGRNTDPITLHKYLYVSANPANKHDPNGFFGVSIAETLGGLSIGQVILSLAVTAVASCEATFIVDEIANGFGVDPKFSEPWDTVCTRKNDRYKLFYRGTSYYDALEIVATQTITRTNLHSGYELGPGLYLTQSQIQARYWASYNGREGIGGGGAVISALITEFHWNHLLRNGALENQPTGGLPEGIPSLQDFVPEHMKWYFNRHAKYSLVEVLP